MKKTALVILVGIAFAGCQRCYTCTGEITSYTFDPFTGEIIENSVTDEQSFCGTGKAGTRDALATMESNGYNCVRTD